MQDRSQEIAQRVSKERRLNPEASFAGFWRASARHVAEAWAEKAGVLKECQSRGIEKLLELRSVRMSVGISLSLIYAFYFEQRASKIGDFGDLHHATTAAGCANVFVCNDRKLRERAKRVPVDSFRVVDFPSFAKSVVIADFPIEASAARRVRQPYGSRTLAETFCAI